MRTIVNKTFEEIALGDAVSVQRTLQAGDVRAWAAAFGDVDMLAGPGESQGQPDRHRDPDRTGRFGPPRPGSLIRATSVWIKASCRSTKR